MPSPCGLGCDMAAPLALNKTIADSDCKLQGTNGSGRKLSIRTVCCAIPEAN